jgi:hypothetical protein
VRASELERTLSFCFPHSILRSFNEGGLSY